MMRYQFLIDTYETECLKTLSVWSMFEDGDLNYRPHATDSRGRSVLEQMVHQCVSEDAWFRRFLDIDVDAPPLPAEETRLGFIRRYHEDSARRLAAVRSQHEAWWEAVVEFFGVERSRAWVFVRRIAHTAHHRGQQMAVLRMLNRDLHSNYGPTADTGGLLQNRASVVYAYPDPDTLIIEEMSGARRKAPLPGPGDKSPTERS